MSTPRPTTFAAGKLAAGAGSYMGFALRDTSGVSSIVRLWDNTTAASGQLLDVIQLPANTDDHWAPPAGVYFVSGVFAEVVSGAVEGLILIA